MSNTTISDILEPFKSGKNIFYLNGDLTDFRLNSKTNKIQKLESLLSQKLLEELDTVLLQFSMATGIHFNHKQLSSTEVEQLHNFLERFHLNQTFEEPGVQFVHLIRQIFDIIKAEDRPVFDTGKPMELAFLFRYIDHLLPQMQPEFREPHQIVALELIDRLSHSLDLRNTSTKIILSGNGKLDQSVRNTLTTISIDYPDNMEQKHHFLQSVKELYTNAKLEESLTDQQILSLTKNTPNDSLEELFRTSHYSDKKLTVKQFSKKREEDVLRRSEGTLSPINPDRLVNRLFGINISKPQKILMNVVDGVRHQSSTTPSNILLVGPKSSGKTDLAINAAVQSGIPSYRLNSPKNKYVGETEKLTRKMFDLLSYTFTPSIGVIDELELQYPMSRDQEFHDSGASSSVTGILQEVLADRSRNGKSLLIGTSNKPTMGASMFERFDLILPVLMPLERDFPKIICGLAKTIESAWTTSPDHPKIKEAARIFYSKHGSPRNILSAFKRAVTCFPGAFNENTVLETANIMRPQANYKTAIYCDLLAIKLSGNETLPWFREDDYPFPDHIRQVMSGDEIDDEKLNIQLSKLEPYAKV